MNIIYMQKNFLEAGKIVRKIRPWKNPPVTKSAPNVKNPPVAPVCADISPQMKNFILFFQFIFVYDFSSSFILKIFVEIHVYSLNKITEASCKP